MDGFTVFQRLRADPRFSKLRAIAVTALGSDEDEALEAVARRVRRGAVLDAEAGV
jgi:CheY-like chemotaxis protein